MFSLRYAQDDLSVRSRFMRLCGRIQGKKVVTLNSNPEACARVLASSNTKGQGIELMIACPAWSPVSSIESVDGEDWEWLADNFGKVFARLDWQSRIAPLTRSYIKLFADRAKREPDFVLDAEQVSRMTAGIMYELVFFRGISASEEEIFFQASLEWRKEIAVKGVGKKEVKSKFWNLLGELLHSSIFADELKEAAGQRDLFLSTFAQPFILSPQINISDIMSAVFKHLANDALLYEKAQSAAANGDGEFLKNICLESIRLNHPFPILERELTRDVKVGEEVLEAGTQVYMMLDEFKQDQEFSAERWLPGARNPYRAMPFGAGQRMCLGKQLAQEMLAEMLGGMLTEFAPEQVKPSANHLYSGRDNDGKDSIFGALYQIRIFLGVLVQCFKFRQVAKRAVCPFTGRQGIKTAGPSTKTISDQ